MLKMKAIQGVLERLKGRRATRVQALVAGVVAGGAVYKLLRSGSDEGESDEGGSGEAGADEGDGDDGGEEAA